MLTCHGTGKADYVGRYKQMVLATQRNLSVFCPSLFLVSLSQLVLPRLELTFLYTAVGMFSPNNRGDLSHSL